MKNNTDTAALSLLANEAGYDPIEDRLRENIRVTIEAIFEEDLDAFLGRYRYDRAPINLRATNTVIASVSLSDLRRGNGERATRPRHR